MKKYFLGLSCFSLIFALSGSVVAAVAVDYGSVSSTAASIAALNINPVLSNVLLAVVAVMQLLKYFFPKIDGR